MMTNLMTISVKKASISSKPTTVYLSCPPLCGLFSIQQNANGGLSYKVKKNPACRILRLRRVALATLFHSAAVRSLAERFLCHRTKFPMTQKRAQNRPLRFCAPVELPERFPPLWEVAPSVVGRCRPAFSERRPKPVLLPGSFCVPLRHRLSDLSQNKTTFLFPK